MLAFAAILGDVDEGAIKLIFFVIVAIIWGIGALISAIKKKAEQMRKGQMPLELTRRMQVQPPQQQGVLRRDQLPPAPAVWPPPPPAVGQVAPPQRKKKKAARPVPPPIPVPPPLQAAPVAVTPMAPARSIAAAPEPAVARATTRATSVRNLLRAPALPTLILISEVLGKPLALRDDPLAPSPPPPQS